MPMSKREMSNKDTDLQNRKKKRLKKLLCWLVVDLSVAFIIFALLLYKPGIYNPLNSTNPSESNEVSPYFLKLSSEINNKAQSGRPFEIVVTQDALNDIINKADWPIESEGILLYAPAAVINPDTVILMGTAKFQGIDFVVTIELQAKINEAGLIQIGLAKIKVGAVNITPLAKITAKKMYEDKIAAVGDLDLDDWRTKVAASLLNDEAFNPVFEVQGHNVKVEKIRIEQGAITASLIPQKKINKGRTIK